MVQETTGSPEVVPEVQLPVLEQATGKDTQKEMNGRWIKLYEKLDQSSIYRDSEMVHLWIHLLIKATKFPYKVNWGGEEITLQPGELITGRKKLSSDLRINESKIQRALKQFEKWHMIEQRTNRQSRIVTILNWNQYQETEQRSNNDRTTNEQRSNTNKKERKKKEDTTYTEAFERWWKISPQRNGRRVGKLDAFKAFQKIPESEWPDLKVATENYKKECGDYAKDPVRFLQKEFWKDYTGNTEQKKRKPEYV
jgi:DNA-binding transcriptional regulator YhcF (GntR family)